VSCVETLTKINFGTKISLVQTTCRIGQCIQ